MATTSSRCLPSSANLLLILICLLAGWPYCIAVTDTIKPGEVMGFEDQLVSSRGKFTMGFFNPQNSDNGYLAIWYTDDQYDKKVWIANRNNSISGKNGNLTLDANGILKIQNEEGTLVTLNSPDRAATNSKATLDDSGNFILSELDSSDGSVKEVLWQSYDHPTDTLLPGMKLGANFVTGKNWTLSSWLSDEVAEPGAFSLEWDWNAKQLVMRRRGNILWKSGALDNQNKSVANVGWLKESWRTNDYTFNYVSNESGSYFYYSVTSNRISWWNLRNDGSIFDTDQIMLGGQCLISPSNFGCEVQESLGCKAPSDTFAAQVGQFQTSANLYDGNASIGLSDCQVRCWNNCSCIAYSTFNGNGTGCFFWSTGSIYQQTATASSTVYVLNSYLSRSNDTGKWWIWVIVPLVALVAVLLLGWLIYIRRRKLKEEKERHEEEILYEFTTSNRFHDSEEIGDNDKKVRQVIVFSVASIMAATNNFSFENKLGQGGFGPVYKGTMPEGLEIAVKTLSKGSGQGLEEFKNEIVLIAKLQHINLVRLLGCCIQGEQKMLVYEYMPNKSLDFFLFDPNKRAVLDWRKRYNIIEGVAQGLLYLHKYSRHRIIHRDLKASNILLDNDMIPKISDFGLARIFRRNDTEANTNRVVGTYGYMSPEYAMEGIFSEKSDVYSFGVLMLEIVSGRKNSSAFNHDRPISLVAFTWQLWEERNVMEMVDSSMTNYSRDQILRCIQVGLLCVQESAVDRSTMSEVMSMLNNESMVLPAPKEPAFITQNSTKEVNPYKGESKSCSINMASITVMEAR